MLNVIPGVGARIEKCWKYIRKELNFYRIHLIFFIITPLLFSIILYLSNGRYKISFVDCVYNSFSSMTVTGLTTVNLSTMTPWQQVLLFIEMCIGSPVVASWVMVLQRRRYIRKSCSHIFTDFMAKKKSEAQRKGTWLQWLRIVGIPSSTPTLASDEGHSSDKEREKSGSRNPPKVRPDMIRRMDDKPMLINPSGLVTSGPPQIKITDVSEDSNLAPPLIRYRTLSSEVQNADGKGGTKANDPFPRALTVEFASDLPRPRLRNAPTITENDHDRTLKRHSTIGTNVSLREHPTHHTGHSARTYLSSHNRKTKNQGYGGFPMPYTILKKLFRALFPKLERKLTRTLTVPMATSLVSTPTKHANEKHAPYIRESIRVGRNSQFDAASISQDQLIEIAYLEYQALGLLLWVIALYHFGTQILAFIVIAPYISTPRWSADFVPPDLVRPVNTVWFSGFQAVSAYTNTGTSLVDQSLLPFQEAYPLLLAVMFLILAGNTCFPIFFRFFVWCLSKVAKKDTDMHKVLRFLLDHPRRCYLYLFPSHQTWFLFFVVILLNSIDWLFLLILDLNNVALETIPTGARVIDGLVQAVAVRAGGFAVFPIAALAPAVKVLYVIMMYIGVFPIAMSIRSTNVYEEKSLGIYHDDRRWDEDEEDVLKNEGPRMTVWSRYLALHVRQQLAFDMWWLGISLFILCIAESPNIRDPEKFEWFTIFNILFELVSAYGTVGLSVGLPYDNYSLSGAFRPISKLIMCVVMIRGRHRGLPVAIDRAVMFPREYQDSRSIRPDDYDSDTDSSYLRHYENELREQGLQTVPEDLRGSPSASQLELDLKEELGKAMTPKDTASDNDLNVPGPVRAAQLQSRSQSGQTKEKDRESVGWHQDTSHLDDNKSSEGSSDLE